MHVRLFDKDQAQFLRPPICIANYRCAHPCPVANFFRGTLANAVLSPVLGNDEQRGQFAIGELVADAFRK
ncbi:hypothetical protein IB61_11535 [Brucella abortus LMN2]|nr:hypothetical protein IB61_11535 [Brucella abortus LMN2]